MTKLCIIIVTWLCNYRIYHNGRHTQKAKPVQGVSHKRTLQLQKYNKQTNKITKQHSDTKILIKTHIMIQRMPKGFGVGITKYVQWHRVP